MFYDTKVLRDSEIVLRLKKTCQAQPEKRWLPAYYFDICLQDEETVGSTCDLTCPLDPQRSVITFAEYGSKRNYYFRVTEYSDHSILQLEQTILWGSNSYIYMKLNPFLISKLSAEPLPYSQHSF